MTYLEFANDVLHLQNIVQIVQWKKLPYYNTKSESWESLIDSWA
jgi:hypothetical protein